MYKKASTLYTCTRHRGDVNNEGQAKKRAAKIRKQNVVKQRDVKWQVCLRDCVHSQPLIKSLP